MKLTTTILLNAALALAFCLPIVAAQGAPESTEYKVGPGDVLTITIVGANVSQVSRVSNSGKVHFPRVGVISVDSLTLREVAGKLEDELKSRELVRDPVVNVEVNQSRARPVYILGEVLMPGQFVINERMLVLDLLTLSGGLNEVATDVAYLYRRKPAQPKVAGPEGPEFELVDSTMDEAIPIYFDKLYEGTEESGNIELQGGDVLYVPVRRRDFFYVVGDVRDPGQVEIPAGEKIPATRALGMASGPTKTAKLRKAILAWRAEDGSFEHKSVDLRDILDGKQEDIVLRPGDILFVPGSASKSLALGLLNAVPGFALN